MAIPNFWTTPGEDPKRSYRFLVTFPNMPNGATWYAKKCSKPSMTINEASHKYINHTFYYPGRVEWDKVSVTLVDPVSPDAANNLTALLEAAGYVIPADFTDTTTMSKAAATAMLGEIKIRQLGSAAGGSQPNALETWTLKNAWITSVKFGELDYESDDLTNIEIELRYDWAELTVADSDISAVSAVAGTTVGAETAGGPSARTVNPPADLRFGPRNLDNEG
jgi:hypothetical protein